MQVSLKKDHSLGSYEYMQRVRDKLSREMPELTAYYQAGGLVDSVINQGLPAPIDIQVSSMDMHGAYALANTLAQKIKTMPNVSGVYIPQNLDYPGIALNIDREKASLIGLSAKDVVQNVITAMTSDGMVAPSYWIDPKTGNNYMVTVQYANRFLNNMSMEDFENIPLRGVQPAGYSPMQQAHGASSDARAFWKGDHTAGYTPLSSVADIKLINTPTEVDHYQIRRVIDIYVSTKTEALQGVGSDINKLLANTKTDKNTVLNLRGAVVSMNQSFEEFGIGLILAVLMVYLILMTQFTSFIDPFIILMAIPPGLAGVVMILLVTGSTLNIMSLMGVIMMTGIVVSNSILIVEFAGTLHKQGLPLLEAVVQSCKIRLRPILMTSLATLLGMIPMALGTEAGSEQYAPLARAVIGGLAVSVVVTVFLVPAVYLIVHGRQDKKSATCSRRHKKNESTEDSMSSAQVMCYACNSLFRFSVWTDNEREAAVAGCAASFARRPCATRGNADAADQAGSNQAALADGEASDLHPRLTQSDAEKLAIKNNPRVSVARLLALAQHQVVRETRSAELPTATANITAEDAEDASRISAGSLTASRLFEHAGAGGGFTQLLTDFGRTGNLIASSKLQEKAQNANALATVEDIVLAADQAFFNALQAQALLKVAQQNVSTRQTTETQVSELTKNKLKSTLDLSFADVNLSQAKLLLLDAQNNVDSTMAALDAVLGLDHQVTYDLVDSEEALQAPPTDADQLLQLAFHQRPDLQALAYSQQAAVKYSHAQRDQMLPSISAAGTVGSVPNSSRRVLPYELVGRDRREHEHSDLQWFPLLSPGKGGVYPRPGCIGTKPRLARQDCPGCSHCVACRQYCVSARHGLGGTPQGSESCSVAWRRHAINWDSARLWN